MTYTAHKITVHAPQQDVFEAITTAEGLKSWYAKDLKGEPGDKGKFTLSFPKHEGPFEWKVAEFKPSSLVRWQCESGPGQSKGTSATFRLSSKGADSTVVELQHEGFEETDEKLSTCNTLWGDLLSHLKRYAESEQPEPAFR